MNFLDFALLYLLFFRLSIVAAGIVSVILGYKLFWRCLGGGKDANSTIEAAIAGTKVSIKNAAPGTAFALFGAGLLVVMMIQSAPSVTFDTLSKWKNGEASGQAQEGEQTQKVVLRGGEQNSISNLTAQGIEYEKNGDMANAQRSYEQAVNMIAEPINDLAWRYLQSGRAKDALSLATIAVQLSPGEPRYLDTLDKAKKAGR